ncbi:MAG: hypothetical protein JWO31_1515 [Phycisphaerales bacterium]|nr:hypothetical protein [Phycisphaerales bacterium]
MANNSTSPDDTGDVPTIEGARRGSHVPPPTDHPKSLADWKPGSEGEQAKDVATGGDFGVSVERASQADQDYTNRNTKMSDPGAAQPWSRESLDGTRTAGAGARDNGVGSGSGGDLDPDLVGVGTGGSVVSQSGPSDRSGADDTDGTSDQFASGKHATGDVPAGANRFRGSTFTGEPEAVTSPGGADNATNPDLRDDDSFKAEISSGEARGEDQEIGDPQSA